MNWKNIKYNSDKETINPEWDDVSAKYHYSFMETAILNNMDVTPQRILDIGSGYGHWIGFFKDLLPDAIIEGIEASTENCNKIREKYNVEMFETFIEDTFVTYYKYDLITAIGVLHHIMTDKKLLQALKNIHGVMHENSLLFIGTRFDFAQKEKNSNRIFRTLDQWKELLDKVGFEVISLERSDPNYHIRKHLDLMIVKHENKKIFN